MSEIIGIGACVADTLVTMDAFPKEDSKYRAKETMVVGGGPVSTGLVAAAKLGCSTAYYGVLSTDSAGQFLKSDFEAYGVDTTGIVFSEEGRSFTSNIWLNLQNGSRTCVFDKGDLPPFRLQEQHRKGLEKAKLLMVDGNELDAAVEAAIKIHERSGRVLYDAGGLYEGVERLLVHADYLIPSAEFAKGHTGLETIAGAAQELYYRYHPLAVVITNGAEGGIYYDGQTVWNYPAFPVKVVDSNGAGDVFHGAFATALRKGYSLKECCLFSSMVSSIKCTGLGARKSIPDYITVLRRLQWEQA